jgi:predicted ABC-type transport system involved in lysophospholipase L1 biosynthesis ATPase subunit
MYLVRFLFRTLVVVTHNKTLAQRAGRVVEMRDGGVETDQRALA